MGVGLVLVLAILGGLIGHHLSGGRRLSAGTWYGAGIGVAAGILLPLVLGIVAMLLHLVFFAAAVAVVVLAVFAVLRAFR